MAEKKTETPPELRNPMDGEEFREWGKKMVDYVADYWGGLRDRQPLSDVKPGYIWERVGESAPEKPESWDAIFGDLEGVVTSANTHWHHPHFFAYYPTALSYPAIMADILSGALGAIGFTWNSSPSCTELEMVVMDWLAKALDLPSHFLNADPGKGAGMIQCTASDCTLVGMLAARTRACKKNAEVKGNTGTVGQSPDFKNLVAYSSEQAHSSVERAALLAAVEIRGVKTRKEDRYALRGDTLEAAIQKDLAEGRVPFFVCATVGTTNCCALDNVREIGEVCQKYNLWLHVDAAYAGSACICPEYRKLIDGIEFADSFNFNAHKWLLVNFDCAAMWFKDVSGVENAFLVDPLYLKHDNQGVIPDFRHWQIPLGRRFRSLKLWFVLRAMGVTGLQHNIRKMCGQATEFDALIEQDDRFELFVPTVLGLVCFRLKGSDEINKTLHTTINEDKRIHLVPSVVDGTYYLRLAVCSSLTTSEDIRYAYDVISELATNILKTP